MNIQTFLFLLFVVASMLTSAWYVHSRRSWIPIFLKQYNISFFMFGQTGRGAFAPYELLAITPKSILHFTRPRWLLRIGKDFSEAWHMEAAAPLADLEVIEVSNHSNLYVVMRFKNGDVFEFTYLNANVSRWGGMRKFLGKDLYQQFYESETYPANAFGKHAEALGVNVLYK